MAGDSDKHRFSSNDRADAVRQVERKGPERKQARRSLKRFCLGNQGNRTVAGQGHGTGYVKERSDGKY